MEILVILIAAFVSLVWYIRPIYNFMAKRKYFLLDTANLSFSKRIQSALPAVVFYALIFGLMFYPAYTGQLIGIAETGSILVAQIFIVFILTRYDKRQTKYQVTAKGINYRKRHISWNEKYSLKFKRSLFLILHKPRFIIKSKNSKIVIPMLSHNISSFIKTIKTQDSKLGKLADDLYQNSRAYYIKNLDIEKQINKSN